jgi:hypothetical protein
MEELQGISKPYDTHSGTNPDSRYAFGSRIPPRFSKYIQADFKQRTIELEKVDNNTLVLANNRSLLDLGGSFGVNIIGNKLNQELLMKAVVRERKRERGEDH